MKKINDIYDKVMKESENQKEEIKNEKTKEDDLSRFMPNSEKEK